MSKLSTLRDDSGSHHEKLLLLEQKIKDKNSYPSNIAARWRKPRNTVRICEAPLPDFRVAVTPIQLREQEYNPIGFEQFRDNKLKYAAPKPSDIIITEALHTQQEHNHNRSTYNDSPQERNYNRLRSLSLSSISSKTSSILNKNGMNHSKISNGFLTDDQLIKNPDFYSAVSKNMLREENRETLRMMSLEKKNSKLLTEKVVYMEKEQATLQKSNRKLRRDLASLSKGTQLTEELIIRAQRYRKERNLLIDEVERLREKLEDLKTLASQVRRPKVCTECKEIGNPRKVNIVKLSRVDAFAPTTVGQLNEGMMVKFIGTQRSDDISPVQEGQIEEIMRIDGEDVFVIRMSDDDGDSVFCQIPLRKIIVAWR